MSFATRTTQPNNEPAAVTYGQHTSKVQHIIIRLAARLSGNSELEMQPHDLTPNTNIIAVTRFRYVFFLLPSHIVSSENDNSIEL